MEYIFVSPMIEASQGQLPCRVVGYKRTNHPLTNRPYVTHMEVFTEVDNQVCFRCTPPLKGGTSETLIKTGE